MKFFFRGKIWDKYTKKVMATADEQGVFETEDKELQDKLIALSIDHDLSSGEKPAPKVEEKPKITKGKIISKK